MKTPDSQPLDVFVHVPKTAGTSLRSVVIEHYGQGSTFALHGRTGRLTPAREAEDYVSSTAHERSLARKQAEKVLYSLPTAVHTRVLDARDRVKHRPSRSDMYASADAIIGHFTVKSFDQIFGEQRPTRLFTVVRNPLERMQSHYGYGLQLLMRGQPLGWAQGQDFSKRFEDFALSDAVLNFQTRYTGSDPSRFVSIGVTERAATFMRQLDLISDIVETPHYNKTEDSFLLKSRYGSGFFDEFRSAHSLDYNFYNEASKQQLVLHPDSNA